MIILTKYLVKIWEKLKKSGQKFHAISFFPTSGEKKRISDILFAQNGTRKHFLLKILDFPSIKHPKYVSFGHFGMFELKFLGF